MKIICEKALLLDAVLKASWAVSAKSAIPTMEGLLLNADKNLTITGYDLEVGIQTVINADIITPGSIVINAKLFCDIVRKLPDKSVTLFLKENELKLFITCDKANFDIMGISAEEFPRIPEIESDFSLSLSQNTLKSMIYETIFAISTNQSRPIHTGSLFEVTDNILNVVSIDGFRLAVRTENINNKSETKSFSFVVPGRALKEIEKICKDIETDVEIMVGKKHITFSVENTIIISRIIDGEFLNYRNAIPKSSAFTAKVATEDLINSIELNSTIIDEKIKTPIKLSFSETSISISCVTSKDQSQDICPLLSPGDNLDIGFNNRYLLDALKACPDAEVLLELNTHVSPLIIRPVEGDKFLYLILPVRLKTISLNT